MTGERRVSIRVERRRVVLDDASGEPDTASCVGIMVVHHFPGCPDDERWLPMGDEPSEADDEALVVLLRDALRWGGGGFHPGWWRSSRCCRVRLIGRRSWLGT